MEGLGVGDCRWAAVCVGEDTSSCVLSTSILAKASRSHFKFQRLSAVVSWLTCCSSGVGPPMSSWMARECTHHREEQWKEAKTHALTRG